tara:strand:+ start:564 stop:1613 length:1050 start_codon:yes stop_codon:yes gene_type:complete
MNVVFRVDSSEKIGSGHVMRCLALAKILKDNNSNVIFICRKFKGNLIDKIRSNGFKVFELALCHQNSYRKSSSWLGIAQKQDAEQCLKIIKHSIVDWLIVDHYGIDQEWEKILKAYCSKIMIIDDLADRMHECDLLLDQTFGRKKDDYLKLVPKQCNLLIGSNFALLREEFSSWREYSLNRRVNFNFQKLFINMGGVDPDNYTEDVLIGLNKCNFPDNLEVIVVMGPNSPNQHKVTKRGLISLFKVEVIVDPKNIAEIMASCDLAIGASGSSSMERCCLGLPSIQLVTADNQLLLAKKLTEMKLIKFIHDVEELPNLLKQPINWASSLSYHSSKICDGNGALNVYNNLQ